MGIGPKIIVLDVSNPATPTVVGESAPLSAQITNIALKNDFIYVTSNDKRLHIISISDSVKPIKIGSREVQIDASDIVIRDQYVFLVGSNDSRTANVFNIADPTTPVEVGTYHGTGHAADIGLINNYAYVSSRQGRLSIVKLSGKEAPVEVGLYDMSGFSIPNSTLASEIDKTPPTLTFGTPSPEPNMAGWNNTDVTIDFSASDDLSGLASISSPVTLSNEGANQSVIGMATDMAGNIAWTKVSGINIDKTLPTISGSIAPRPNANGWNNTDVTATFIASDTLSGLATAPGKVVLASEGANQSVVGTATDRAGNSASYTVSNINIDKSKPFVDIVEPKVGLYQTSQSIKIVYAAADEISGIDTIIANLDGKPVDKGDTINLSKMAGNHKLTVIARDKAGNETTTSADFVVRVAGTLRIEPATIIRAVQDTNPIAAYIKFPSNYDVNLIDVSSLDCGLDGRMLTPLASSARVADHDGDGIAEMMVQFDRDSIAKAIGADKDTATVTIDGRLKDRRYFVGNAYIRVISTQAPR